MMKFTSIKPYKTVRPLNKYLKIVVPTEQRTQAQLSNIANILQTTIFKLYSTVITHRNLRVVIYHLHPVPNVRFHMWHSLRHRVVKRVKPADTKIWRLSKNCIEVIQAGHFLCPSLFFLPLFVRWHAETRTNPVFNTSFAGIKYGFGSRSDIKNIQNL